MAAAAKQVGCPQGILSVRLVRGRAMLAKRLARRGLAVSAAVLATALCQNAVSACLPGPLVVSTVKAATLLVAGKAAAAGAISAKVAVLMEGVLKTMLLTKIKVTIAVVLALNLIGAGVALVYCQTAGTGQDIPGKPAVAQGKPNPAGQQPAPKKEAKEEDNTKEKVCHQFMPGTKITLKPRKTKYFLGENILLDYQVSYDGDGGLEVDSYCGLGSDDCAVIATDQAGNQAPASTLGYHGTGSSGRPLHRGDSISFTIPLIHYCRLDKPGTYRIRGAHNLNWSDGDTAAERSRTIPKDDPRWAETTIEVSMPDEAQARKVVEDMRRLKTDVDYYRHSCGWETGDYADFRCLQYPVYLPILKELAAGKHSDNRLLLGIIHNPTPEATEALLRLLKDADKDRVKRIISALCDRLPDPQGVDRPGRANPIGFEDDDPKLVKHSWRGDFAVPLRRFARKMLSDDDLAIVRSAAFILEALGTREDMPALVAAASRMVPILEKTEPSPYIGEITAIREACSDTTYAVEALVGASQPATGPRTPGEIIHFTLMVKQHKDFRPTGWEKRCVDWLRDGTPYVGEFVLFNAPRPLPDSLLEPFQEEESTR